MRRFNFNRKTNETKTYEIRLSDELLSGFLTRYYVFDVDGYYAVARSSKGVMKTQLYVFLSRIAHILHSTKDGNTKHYTVDYLCSIAGLNNARPQDRKKYIWKFLRDIQEVGNLDIECIESDAFPNVKTRYKYGIDITFKTAKKELPGEHLFYITLLNKLREYYNYKYSSLTNHEGEKDMFQRWLISRKHDADAKINILQNAHETAYRKKLGIADAREAYYYGISKWYEQVTNEPLKAS